MVKRVFICSSLKGNVEENIEKAKVYSRYAIVKGYVPITPHIYFTQFLDDNDVNERFAGIRMGLSLMDVCDEMWIFGDVVSEGMKKEIESWKRKKGDSRLYYITYSFDEIKKEAIKSLIDSNL